MAENDFPPQIPGGSNYLTMTPGSAVADTLQQILAQRRAQSQQDLINKMSQEKQSAELQHWQNMDDYNKESRESLAEERHQRAADRAAQEARRQRFGDALKSFSTQTVPPQNPLVGPVDPLDTTDTTGQSQKPVPITSQFEPSQQRALQILQSLGPDDPSSPALLNTLLAQAVKPDQEYEPEGWFDEKTKTSGTLSHLVKKGTPSHFIPIGAEQFRPTQSRSIMKPIGVDDKNNQVFETDEKDPETGRNMALKYGPDGSLVKHVGQVFRPGGKPNATYDIPTTELMKIQQFRSGNPTKHIPGAVPTERGALNPARWFGDPTAQPDPQALATWRNAAKSGAANLHLPPLVLAAFNELIDSDAVEPYNSDEVVSKSVKPGALTSDETAGLVKLLSAVRGK